MPVSRRSFITTLGAGGAAVLARPVLDWRGHESLWAFQGQAERRADRLLATKPGMVRLDSNENPNGPGQRVYDTIIRHISESNRYPVKSEDDLIAVLAKIHNVSPANIEAALKTIPLVGQAMAIGEAKPYLVAVLTLDPDAVKVRFPGRSLADTDRM